MLENLKKLVSYYKPYKKVFMADMFFAIMASFIALLIPLVVRYVTAKVIYMPAEQVVKTMIIIAIVVGILILFQCYCNYYIANYGHVMGAKIEYDMRAEIFGHFQKLLSNYPAETLNETIKGFHDTESRLIAFKEAVEKDSFGRAAKVQKEIRFVLEREEISSVFGKLLAKGEIPLRVTHNDTKLNNIMIDYATGKGLCVIDLDTIMPGLAMNDFGDSIRFGASTAAEDEKDLEKVTCSMELFELYTKGFLEECREQLTTKEIELLPMGAKVMTFECGIRFLTDYLEGDHYFKIHREDHNLDRCRTQFKLVADMEKKWDLMQKIVAKYQ